MPRPAGQPAYRRHKARGCAVVTIDGRNHYLGRYDSPESHEKYARLIAEWRRNGGVNSSGPASPAAPAHNLTVAELLLAYWKHVQTYYVKNGRPTSEQDNIRQALRFVRRLYGHSRAADFGTKALQNVRQAMAQADRCRRLINKDVHRVRAMFRWAVAEEMLPSEAIARLAALRGLRKGRSDARETEKVRPVSVEHVEATLPHLPPPVAAMVRLQLLTGMRPQEAAGLRPREVTDTGDGVWLYHPGTHKTEHLDRDKVVVLGPRAQDALRPWLARDPDAFCFAPAESTEWRNEKRRKRPADADSTGGGDDADKANHRRPGKRGEGSRVPGERYTRHSYRVAVRRACLRAGVPVWTPRQLRHTRATLIRRQFGLEASKAVLGHTDTKVTEIYAERDLELARVVMREVG